MELFQAAVIIVILLLLLLLSSKKINSATQVQILEEAFAINFAVMFLGKAYIHLFSHRSYK